MIQATSSDASLVDQVRGRSEEEQQGQHRLHGGESIEKVPTRRRPTMVGGGRSENDQSVEVLLERRHKVGQLSLGLTSVAMLTGSTIQLFPLRFTRFTSVF